MASDAASDRLVLFGYDNGYRDDTWEYVRDPAFIVGAGRGAPNPNRVAAFQVTGAPTAVDFFAYAAGAWGASATCGELNGAGSLDEIVTTPGPGPVLGPQVRGFLRDATAIAKINFFAYGTLKYGANVAPRSIDADGYDEILTGAGPGEVFGPHVRAFDFDGSAVSVIAKVSYFAYGTLKYGAELHASDVELDGFQEILTAPGPGVIFGPQVRGWNFDGAALTSISKINFNAFPTLQYGGVVSGASVDYDDFGEICASPGPGPALNARYVGFDYDGVGISALPGFDQAAATLYGGRLGLGATAGGDSRGDLLAAAGPDPAADTTVRVFDYETGTLSQRGSFVAFSGLFFGVGPGSGDLGY
ncbi:MAG: hypothetical protein U0166_25895 [Acidobacteriota bacterium]